MPYGSRYSSVGRFNGVFIFIWGWPKDPMASVSGGARRAGQVSILPFCPMKLPLFFVEWLSGAGLSNGAVDEQRIEAGIRVGLQDGVEIGQVRLRMDALAVRRIGEPHVAAGEVSPRAR
jgi:hypothetical protein